MFLPYLYDRARWYAALFVYDLPHVQALELASLLGSKESRELLAPELTPFIWGTLQTLEPDEREAYAHLVIEYIQTGLQQRLLAA